ncbi:MAG: hypothetical protein ACFFE2_05175 [Candidatus Thorarchaeota archaeon]
MQTSTSQYLRAVLLLLLLLPLSFVLQTKIGVFATHLDDELIFSTENKVEGVEVLDSSSPIFQYTPSGIDTPPSKTGTMNPVQVEQSGYYSTGNMSARTDTSAGTENSFPIDTDHHWKASTAEIDIWNLERLYIVNGTFDQGLPGYTLNPNSTLEGFPLGWEAASYSTDPQQIQLVSYDDGGRGYVSVQNQAQVTNNPQHIYTHFAGTSVFWNQTIDISPYTNQFVLSFDYLYLQGLLNSSFSGDFFLQVEIDGDPVYTVDLPSLTERGSWYSTGDVPITVPVSPGLAQFTIGLVINNTMIVDGDIDYDLDTFPDGAPNTQIITVYIDDVNLVASSPPDCDSVALEFSVNGSTSPITGTSGIGSSQITNQSYWTKTSLRYSISSNSSISFDYSTRLLNHRFNGSSSTTDISNQGVAYKIETGMSGTLEMFTYLGFLGVYEDLKLTLYHASDWTNFTVFDPFLTDVTSSCTFISQSIIIPESILDRLGWWKITCDIPNYAASAAVERFDSIATNWVNESVFHSGDDARLTVTISSETNIPALSDPVNFTWALSNGSIWYQSSTTGGSDGTTSSSSVSFGPANTTAGIWEVRYLWSNGTELAYDYTAFSLHHIAVLEAVYSTTVEVLVGQPVSVFLRFLDAENGLYILNDGATVVGNWTGGNVSFVADIVKNWWQADFDTGLLGPGDYAINIVSAAPFFETVPLIVTVKTQSLASLDPPTGPLAPLIYGRQYSFDFFYSMSHNGTGIEGATVNLTEDGSQWAAIENTGNGHYELSIIPAATGDFSIRLTFSKTGYETEFYVMSFLVDDVPIEVESISSLVGLELTPLDVEVNIVETDTGNPVTDANVTLGVYRPGGVIYFYSQMNETSSGVYSVTIPMPPSDTGTYTVRISVEKPNHVMTQTYSAALVPTFDSNVRLVQTFLRYSWQIGIGVIIIIGAVTGQRARTRKQRQKHATAQAIKDRFNDANNILGFMVLHKLSGVPIYSRIFKGGFEEGMLSAFITAIMHFRNEFDSNGAREDYKIIPISEVIRVVPTENLVCAFITVTSPSVDLEYKMKSYSRAIGMMFDEPLAEVSAQVIDAKMSNTFEMMFDDFMDGILIRKYQIGEKKFPKRLRFIEKAIPLEEKDGAFNLNRLIRLLTSSGVGEDEVYIRMLRAIEDDYIIPALSLK